MQASDFLTELLAEFRCPICKEILVEPYATDCGHCFCRGCISTHLNNRRKCPCCSTFLAENNIRPIFALDKMVAKAAQLASIDIAPPVEQLKTLLASTTQLQSCADVDELIKVLKLRRLDMGQRQQEVSLHLLLQFLQKAKTEMLQKAQGVKAQMQCLGKDIAAVKRKRDALKVPGLPTAAQYTVGSGTQQSVPPAATLRPATPVPSMASAPSTQLPSALTTPAASPSGQPQACVRLEAASPRGDAGSAAGPAPDSHLEALTRKLIAKKKCVVTQFYEFQALYLSMCRQGQAQQGAGGASAVDVNAGMGAVGDAGGAWGQRVLSGAASEAGPSSVDPEGDAEGRVAEFGHVLSMATQYVELKKIGEMLPSKEANGRVPTLSAIEFSSDQHMFALGSHSQPIRIYNYEAVLSAGAQVHRPMQEVAGSSRVSSVAWSFGTKEHLLHCGTPEGAIVLWNVATGQELRTFQGHSKRVWSVHFSPREHQLFVSGSDDASVKVWAANREDPVITLALGFNVCCAQFSPDDANLIALGTAGHTVSVYDIRSTAHPLAMLQGHRKAVSYVKFLNGKDLVSCSVDNSLCLWDIPSASLVRTYCGHVNKKNFVGMSVNGSYIACGSESSQVHVFYKQVCRPILDFMFSMQYGTETTSCFTSAVTWKPNSTHLLAATSLGNVAILSMSD